MVRVLSDLFLVKHYRLVEEKNELTLISLRAHNY